MNAPEITTLEDFLTWASDLFEANDLYYGHGTDNSWDEAVMLAMYVIKFPPDADAAILEQSLTEIQKEQLVELVKLRVKDRIPVPYLTNEAWFAGERYYVNEHVLIPRSPIAELINNHFQPWLNAEPKHILDLCTGSGCLAICVSKEFPDAQVDGVDISSEAIEVAHKNVLLHDCKETVHIIQSDLFQALNGKRYDLIISNPPYVGEQEMNDLPAEYTHEPVLALESGVEGLDLTVKILKQAANYLNDGGLLIIEVGYSWPALEELYPNVAFTWIEFEHGGEGVFILTKEELLELTHE